MYLYSWVQVCLGVLFALLSRHETGFVQRHAARQGPAVRRIMFKKHYDVRTHWERRRTSTCPVKPIPLGLRPACPNPASWGSLDIPEPTPATPIMVFGLSWSCHHHPTLASLAPPNPQTRNSGDSPWEPGTASTLTPVPSSVLPAGLHVFAPT